MHTIIKGETWGRFSCFIIKNDGKSGGHGDNLGDC